MLSPHFTTRLSLPSSPRPSQQRPVPPRVRHVRRRCPVERGTLESTCCSLFCIIKSSITSAPLHACPQENRPPPCNGHPPYRRTTDCRTDTASPRASRHSSFVLPGAHPNNHHLYFPSRTCHTPSLPSSALRLIQPYCAPSACFRAEGFAARVLA